jgi:hypothetical protein
MPEPGPAIFFSMASFATSRAVCNALSALRHEALRGRFAAEKLACVPPSECVIGFHGLGEGEGSVYPIDFYVKILSFGLDFAPTGCAGRGRS